MIRSPRSSARVSLSIVSCVGSPAGSISHTMRGGFSFRARSRSERAPLAP